MSDFEKAVRVFDSAQSIFFRTVRESIVSNKRYLESEKSIDAEQLQAFLKTCTKGLGPDIDKLVKLLGATPIKESEVAKLLKKVRETAESYQRNLKTMLTADLALTFGDTYLKHHLQLMLSAITTLEDKPLQERDRKSASEQLKKARDAWSHNKDEVVKGAKKRHEILIKATLEQLDDFKDSFKALKEEDYEKLVKALDLMAKLPPPALKVAAQKVQGSVNRMDQAFFDFKHCDIANKVLGDETDAMENAFKRLQRAITVAVQD